ncbi:MAG: pantoate--beta-alanine ligase [Chthonomonadales bacterium]
MRTLKTVAELRAYIRAARYDGKVIGFVPTMGAFHEGHLTLMRRARSECDVVVVSLFVNPTQFAPGEDYERYPRDPDRDSRLAQEIPVDALFMPEVAEMYPPGWQTVVDVPDIASRWEGASRPGHFRGVATVCARLFNLVQPHYAFFGRKDYQQLKLIERMVKDLAFPLEVVPVETVRDPDGLALSSRNAYLTQEERAAAPVLYRALKAAEALYLAGERSAATLEAAMRSAVENQPLVQLDYAAVAHSETLEPLEEAVEPAVLLIAARIGTTRLIDNLLLNGPREAT